MHSYVYSDFDSTLTINPSGNIKILYDEDVIKQSIKHIMATVQGERVRSPFGGSLVRYLFQPITQNTANTIRRELSRIIQIYEPRVRVTDIEVEANIDNNYYDVEIVMEIAEINTRMTFDTRIRSFVV